MDLLSPLRAAMPEYKDDFIISELLSQYKPSTEVQKDTHTLMTTLLSTITYFGNDEFKHTLTVNPNGLEENLHTPFIRYLHIICRLYSVSSLTLHLNVFPEYPKEMIASFDQYFPCTKNNVPIQNPVLDDPTWDEQVEALGLMTNCPMKLIQIDDGNPKCVKYGIHVNYTPKRPVYKL